MGILKLVLLICMTAGWLSITAAAATVGIPPLMSEVDGELNGTGGAGNIYSAGSTITLRLGSERDESNRSGEFHFSYTNQLSPIDPNDPNSPSKHADNWAGGLQVKIWKRATLGVDLDSLSDNYEFLSSDGAKFILGYDPLKFSYRYARNVINTAFTVPTPNRTLSFKGAFIYQQTLELELALEVGDQDLITPSVSYSFFNPDAPAFADLINQPALATLSNFQDTLQNFEQWSVGLEWKHFFGKKWDSTAGARTAHLIIPGSPSFATTLALGYKVAAWLHLQAGWNYNYDSLSHQSIAAVELRFTWDRERKGPPDPSKQAENEKSDEDEVDDED